MPVHESQRRIVTEPLGRLDRHLVRARPILPVTGPVEEVRQGPRQLPGVRVEPVVGSQLHQPRQDPAFTGKPVRRGGWIFELIRYQGIIIDRRKGERRPERLKAQRGAVAVVQTVVEHPPDRGATLGLGIQLGR